MSSVGSAIGGIGGAAIGFFLGGPTGALYGAQIGMGVGGLIDPPKGPNLQGPRLSDLSVQTSTYGAVIPRIYVTMATAGNIFWLEGDKLKETAVKTKQGGKGGPTSTTTTYTYSATFAVGLCRGPIEGVRRVWVGSKLIYDAGGGDIDTIVASRQKGSLFGNVADLVATVIDRQWFVLYKGDEAQEPDPRIQADKGVANTPAYKGLSYIVFYDLPLADFGNSLLGAQVKVEVVVKGSTVGWERFVSVTDTGVSFGVPFAPGIGKPYPVSADGAMVVGIYDSTKQYVFALDGTYLGQRTASVAPIATGPAPWLSVGRLGGRYLFCRINLFTGAGPVLSLGSNENGTTPIDRIDLNLPPNRTIIGTMLANDGESVIVLLGEEGVTGAFGASFNNPVWYILNKSGTSIANGTTNFPASTYTFGFARGESNNLSITNSYDQDSGFIATAYTGAGGEVNAYQVDSDNVIRKIGVVGTLTEAAFNWPGVYTSAGVIHAFSRSHYNVFLNNRLIEGTDTLSSIVSAECAQSKYLQPSDYDTSALTSLVRGYRVASNGSIRSALEPLQAAWPFDVVQAGYAIKFKPRGGASVATVTAAELDARAGGDTPGVEIAISREMDSQLPARVRVNHLDFDREYDNGSQSADRVNTDSVNVLDVEMPIVLTASEAAKKAEVLLYLYWMERTDIRFRLPPAYLHLEPADVITITTSDASYECRLVSVSYLPDGRLECTAKFNSAAVYVSTATGEAGTVVGQSVALEGPTLYQLLDVPCLTSEMNEPSMLAAMTGYTSGWPGGILFRSSDGGQSWSDVQAWAQKCTIGTARATMASRPPDVLDSSLTLQVDMIGGALESVSLISALGGANHFAYGQHGRWEIIAALTCTLQGDGSYILSDFLRGRFGTSQHSGSHAAGDYLIHLNDPDVAFIGMDSASIGSPREYRGITAGRSIDSDADLSFTYSANNLKPLSPVHLTGYRHATTNDWHLSWFRRTRVDGEWRDSVDASLGESSEAYEIDVFSSVAFTTLKRTLTSASQAVTYTSANQVTDFGSNQSTIHLKIYQMSATVGRGFPLTVSITR